MEQNNNHTITKATQRRRKRNEKQKTNRKSGEYIFVWCHVLLLFSVADYIVRGNNHHIDEKMQKKNKSRRSVRCSHHIRRVDTVHRRVSMCACDPT